jgi:hypothetical protein
MKKLNKLACFKCTHTHIPLARALPLSVKGNIVGGQFKKSEKNKGISAAQTRP